jgi:hypothetical protein
MPEMAESWVILFITCVGGPSPLSTRTALAAVAVQPVGQRNQPTESAGTPDATETTPMA